MARRRGKRWALGGRTSRKACCGSGRLEARRRGSYKKRWTRTCSSDGPRSTCPRGSAAGPPPEGARTCTGRKPPAPTWRHGKKERSEEHTSELQSLAYLVCRLLLEKKKKIQRHAI